MSTTEDGGGVSESLEGLVGALDKLKQSLGYGDEFALVEQHVQELQQENEELRQFAEAAILEAQRLRDMNEELEERVTQQQLEERMGAVLAETQKLRDVADDFERDMIEEKMAEMKAKDAEIQTLQERVTELEDENEGLTQTLNEFRQTTQQLQRLQSHEVRRLQQVEKGSGKRPEVPGAASIPEAGAEGSLAAAFEGTSSPAGPASGACTPKSGVSGSGTPFTSAAPRFAAAAAAGVAAGVATAATAGGVTAQPCVRAGEAGTSSLEVDQIAQQLEEVAGSDRGGLLASAARVLREYGITDVALQQERQENKKLRTQVAELNDTMFSKTFKPPSAWAEREIKYKTDKKVWEEHQKELQERITLLTIQIEGLKGSSGTHSLEARIEELEARLLQSEREKDNLKSQLHETQLSMRQTGEFGNAGVRLSPYRPAGSDVMREGEVHGLVHQMEEAHVGMQTPSASSAEVASRTQQLEAKLAKAEGEREALRAQLMELQPVELPPSLHKQLGTCMTAGVVESRAAALEHDLEEADAETEQLARELRELQAALLGLQVEDATSVLAGRMAAVGTGPVAGAAAAASPEAAAATPSQDAAAATGLLERAHQQAADLQVRLEQLERRNRELAELLEEVQPGRLQIQMEAAERPDEVISVPLALREVVGGAQAPAALVEEAAQQLSEQATAARGQTTALADQLQQVQQLQAWLRQAEYEKGALRQQLEDLQPVQLHISAAVQEAERAGVPAREKLATLTVPVPASLQEDLGKTVPAAKVVAIVAQLEQESAAAAEASSSLQEQLQQVLAVTAALQGKEQERRQAESDLQTTLRTQRDAAVMPASAAASASGGRTRQRDAAMEQAQLLQAKLRQLRRQESSLQSELTRAHKLQLQLRQAESEKRNLQGELQALESVADSPVGLGEERRNSLPVDKAEKAAAIAQLQDELHRAQATAASLRQQLHQQASAMAVQLGINVQEAPGAAPLELGISVHDAAPPTTAPFRFGITVVDAQAGSGSSSAPAARQEKAVVLGGQILDAAAAVERTRQLEARLRHAEQERASLRQQLEDLQPVRLQLRVAGSGGGGAPGPAAARGPIQSSPLLSAEAELEGEYDVGHELSEASMVYSPEQASALARDRAAADAAWDEHVKNSDLSALRRVKAELETRCQMLEAQVRKMSGQLVQAEQDKAVVEQGIDAAMATGDVGMLAGLRDRMNGPEAGSGLARQASGSGGPSGLEKSFKKMGTMFKRGSKNPSPSKDNLKSAVHELQDALAASEQERNMLKRQLAKLSKKYQQATVSAAQTAGIVAGASAMAYHEENGHGDGGSSSADADGLVDLSGLPGDDEVELMKLREENQMLMEHLVMNKVRLAETEGDYLESKRALLRAREKQLALVKKINELRTAYEAGQPMPTGSPVASLSSPDISPAQFKLSPGPSPYPRSAPARALDARFSRTTPGPGAN